NAMNAPRILLLSNARPLRAWRVAQRIMQEIPGAEICGMIQQPMEKLPLAQGLVASGDQAHGGWFRSLREKLLHGALWCLHGCPHNLNAAEEFSVEELAQKCGP